jgi:hypothetical protein
MFKLKYYSGCIGLKGLVVSQHVKYFYKLIPYSHMQHIVVGCTGDSIIISFNVRSFLIPQM